MFKLNRSRLMITGENNMNEYQLAKKVCDVSVGESVKIIRELQELSQNELAELTGIPQSTLSAIEHDKINLGLERAKILAKALKCHPAVLVFPGWNVEIAT
jgi:transcriptional regulator with XRE-family HTH domain